MTVSTEDRGSRIRITTLRAINVGGKGYVKIETNMDVVGWGEINNMDTKVACALAESLSEILIGENPTRIEHLWQRMFRSHRNIRGGGLMVHTISGIDMALWDITGKLWGVPVYRLMGGPVRDKIWKYPSPKGIKISPPGGPLYHAGTPAEIETCVAAVHEARKKVGPDGAVMFDAHSRMPAAFVKQFAAQLKPDDLLFLEEAWVPGNIEVMRRVRETVPVPLATGERDRTIWEVREILEAQVIDILQPDVGHTGGLTQFRKIGTLCEAHHVPVAPHCTMSYLGLTASLHALGLRPLLPHPRGLRRRPPRRHRQQDLGDGRRRIHQSARGTRARRRDRRSQGDRARQESRQRLRVAGPPPARRLRVGLLECG